jgi:ABC-type antimicrobial peptide transport system permease subunit
MVRQRTREIGIRMALGATQTRVRHMVLRRGLYIAATGAIAGIGGALLTTHWLAGLLFQVTPTDAATLGSVAGLIIAVAMLASVIPAWASMRIDPAIALRSDD